MNTIRCAVAALVTIVAFTIQSRAQGTLVFDQQSANSPVSTFDNGVDGFYIQTEPLTQSFVPTLSAIDFVQFEFEDVPGNGNSGATVYVNLWTGSPNINSAALLGSTAPVYMPNGFMNNNLGLAGLTTFNFSDTITLTRGQTYYFQPVVLSGDNPWAIITLTNTYPGGQLYGRGSAEQPGSDFWFREGVVSVPEPAILALLGLAGLLLIMHRRCRKFLLIASFTIGLSSAPLAHADTAFYLQSYGGIGSVPFPMNPYGDAVPMTEVSPGIYLVEDGTGGQLQAMDYSSGSAFQAGANESGTNQYQPHFQFDTNGLWLEVLNTNGIDTNLWLRLHGTVSSDNYQLLSTRDLASTNWDLGQILFHGNADHTDFSPLSTTNALKLYRAHHANPIMAIGNSQDSVELNPTNSSNPGQVGIVYIWDEALTNDVTVYYQISGTAQNGVDYSNLTGTVVVGPGGAEIDIEPLAVGLTPDKTIILTLSQNTNYLIDPDNSSATNILYANPEVVPIAHGDIETPCPNTSRNIQLNADDPQGLPLTYTIQTYPAHGTLTGTPPNLTYTPTNCYEGTDSFTFIASNGQFDSAPATVSLFISDPVVAYPVRAQTCRGTPVTTFLSGGDGCAGMVSYDVLSGPLHGTLSGTAPSLTYTPTNASFTGTDSFDYAVLNGCGDAATNTVTITVGDAQLSGDPQALVTGTNQPLAVTLSASDFFDSCGTDTVNFIYTLASNPTHGVLSGTPPSLTYTPTSGFEGQDSFGFAVSDGVWTSSVAPVTLKVTAGPILFHECNAFGTAVELNWMLDTNEQAMFPDNESGIKDFIVYRSAVSGSNYTAIATNLNGQTNWMTCFDTNAIVGQTYYYVVRFEAYDYPSGITVESPISNEIEASPENPGLLIPPDAFWNAMTNVSDPSAVTNLQAPFSSFGTNSQYPGLDQFPNTLWPTNTTWSISIKMFIPSNSVPLSQVTYSIAIDNNYQLYLNDFASPIESFNHEGIAEWSPFKSFESIAPGRLHYGTNDVGLIIVDEGDINYFSMIVSTNDCHGQ